MLKINHKMLYMLLCAIKDESEQKICVLWNIVWMQFFAFIRFSLLKGKCRELMVALTFCKMQLGDGSGLKIEKSGSACSSFGVGDSINQSKKLILVKNGILKISSLLINTKLTSIPFQSKNCHFPPINFPLKFLQTNFSQKTKFTL